MSLNVVVTGGAGFIGANFIHYLFKTYGDDCNVLNIDALTYAGNLENLQEVESNSNYSFVKCNIEDRDAVLSALKAFGKIDFLVHFAAESHVDRSIMDGRPFIISNVLGTQTLLDIAMALGVGRFVHVSTDEVYGSLGTEGVFTEESPIQPSSPYSASKAASDFIALSYYKTHGLPVVVTRCSNNYGPYQFPEKLIPLMLTNALHDQLLPVYGDGLNVRDWIYVEDHCSGIDAVMQKGRLGEVYNLGAETEIPNIEIVKSILTLMKKPESLITYVKDRPGHDFRYAMGIEKAKNELGWSPQMTFERGLAKTIDWYLANQVWWKRIKSGEYQAYYQIQYGGNR